MNNQEVHHNPFSSLIFYQRDRVATRVEGSSSWMLLRVTDQLLAQSNNDVNATRTTILATDINLSVLGAEWAAQPEQIAYLPYGYSLSRSEPLCLPGFNGEIRHKLTGHYLFGGYRAYCPALMRFNSPDSWSPFGDGGLNPYAYAENDPVNHTDPTGHMPQRRRASVPGLPEQVRKPSQSTTRSRSHQGSMTALGAARSYESSGSTMSLTSTVSESSVGLSGIDGGYNKSALGELQAVPDIEAHRQGWSMTKAKAHFVQELSPNEQYNLDIFQNAIFHYQVSPWYAAELMGSANLKQLGNSGIWQVRLSKGGRMTFIVDKKVVLIRDVGGHT